jgi:hypothetical protein
LQKQNFIPSDFFLWNNLTKIPTTFWSLSY